MTDPAPDRPAPPRAALRAVGRAVALNLGAAALVFGVGEGLLRLAASHEGLAESLGRGGIAARPAPRADHAPGASFRWFANPGPRGEPPEFDHRITNNRYGFHGPDHEPRRKPGTKRVAILGDSVIEAYQVARDELMASRLQEIVPGLEAFEFGRAAHSTTRQGKLLELLPGLLRDAQGMDLPGVVVFQVNGPFALRQVLGDDVLKPALWRRGATKVLYSLPRGSGMVDMCRTSVLHMLEAELGPELDRTVDAIAAGGGGADGERAWKALGSAMGSLAARAKELGAMPLFAYFPRSDEVEGGPPSPGRARLAARFASIAGDLGTAWIDLTPAFEEARARGAGALHFPVDTHLTPEGHRVAAAGLAAGLRGLLEGK